MPPEKTDSSGLAALAGKPITIPTGVLLALIGPALGVFGARQMDDHEAQIAALNVQVVQLRADVTRLADTLGDVRKIEEAAHPRVGVPRDSNP